jgi:hypothetical protein
MGNAMEEIRGTRTLPGKIKRYDAKLLILPGIRTSEFRYRKLIQNLVSSV